MIRLGVIADDFTGAGDIANTISKAGARTVLAFGACPSLLPDDVSACVVALKSRSIAADEAIRQSLAALAGLQALGARQIVFKYCSTFDSTAAGNIGPVAEALSKEMNVHGAVVFAPSFPDAGRAVFQGHMFVGDRLLSESGMERHPLNPMTDPDLRRWLALQTKGKVGHLPLAVVHAGESAIRDRLASEAAAGRSLVIADAVKNADLMAIAHAVRVAPLVTGGSAIAAGLVEGATTEAAPAIRVNGPGAVLAGSCSRATLAQVARYSSGHVSLLVDADAVLDGTMTPQQAAGFAARSSEPLIYSSVPAPELGRLQERHGAACLAEALEKFFGDLARLLVDAGVTRLVVAGGETSGAVVTGLGMPLVAVGPEIAVGVPALATMDGALALVLKSGNFGDGDFFETALAAIGTPG